VKKFGEMMVKDHTKLNKQLAAVARKLDRPEPKEMTDEHQRVLERLKGLSGREFDRAYVKHMVEDHEEDIALFTRASKECQAEPLKRLATDALPTLQKHLEMAKKLQDRLGKK
jgi:putative membrane protein